MGATTVEKAALVALLQAAGTRWSEIAFEIHEAGGPLALLEQRAGQPETLFPDAAAPQRLVEAATARLEEWRNDGIDVHAFFDDTYPAQLRDIREMPPLLFTRGRVASEDRAVAVVGSREASEEGVRIARAVSRELALQGITVASGLAAGVDTAAHTAALDAGGRTVAVLGTGINRYYPATNRSLQDKIAGVGLVLSQFWPDAPPSKQSFPMRNAVMSGYSLATIVIEAGERSGARIQARLGLQHGRPVILTDRAANQPWAKAMAEQPGVHVVNGIPQLITVVNSLRAQQPSDTGLEQFPDLAIRS